MTIIICVAGRVRGQVRVDSMSKVAEIEEAEKQKMRNKCKKIIDHGINCFINRCCAVCGYISFLK